jgi:hypothetical protein
MAATVTALTGRAAAGRRRSVGRRHCCTSAPRGIGVTRAEARAVRHCRDRPPRPATGSTATSHAAVGPARVESVPPDVAGPGGVAIGRHPAAARPGTAHVTGRTRAGSRPPAESARAHVAGRPCAGSRPESAAAHVTGGITIRDSTITKTTTPHLTGRITIRDSTTGKTGAAHFPGRFTIRGATTIKATAAHVTGRITIRGATTTKAATPHLTRRIAIPAGATKTTTPHLTRRVTISSGPAAEAAAAHVTGARTGPRRAADLRKSAAFRLAALGPLPRARRRRLIAGRVRGAAGTAGPCPGVLVGGARSPGTGRGKRSRVAVPARHRELPGTVPATGGR